MTMNPVGWFEIYVEDTGRARAFYEAVLGLTLRRLDAPAAGGRVQKPKTSIGPYGFIALAVDTEGNMFGLHSRA